MKFVGKVFEAKTQPEQNQLQHIGERLRGFRKRAGLTQNELASRLQIGQGALSHLEKRSDILLSTLRDYIEALGATLRVDAHFSDPSAIVNHVEETRFRFEQVDEDQLLLPIVSDGSFPSQRDVVFSIKPEYSAQIISGLKTVELRRRFPVKVPSGTTALIYSTSPVRALVGVAEIGDVFKRTPEKIWKDFSERACITRSEFNHYFEGVETGIAIELCRARPLRRSLGLQELRERFKFEPPQSFLYATPELREALENECSEVSY